MKFNGVKYSLIFYSRLGNTYFIAITLKSVTQYVPPVKVDIT